MELDKEYLKILKSLKTNQIVNWPNQKGSNFPMGSWDYFNCNGVILLGIAAQIETGNLTNLTIPRNYAVLTHYGNCDVSPPYTKKQINDYLVQALSTVQSQIGIEKIVAGVTGGDTFHFNTILEFLDKYNIEIRGKYCDGSSDDINIKMVRPTKDLVFSPQDEIAILSIDSHEYYRII